TVHESAWEGSLPAGARETGRRREVHHTDRIQTGSRRVRVGKKDLGNGFFEDVYKDEPIYSERPVHRTKISYDVDRWIVGRTVKAAGADQAAAWPELVLVPGERASAKRESYAVLLSGRKAYR